MRRLIHTLGRYRGTHCEACGRPVTENQGAVAVDGRYRRVHFNTSDCDRSAAP